MKARLNAHYSDDIEQHLAKLLRFCISNTDCIKVIKQNCYRTKDGLFVTYLINFV